MVVLALLAFRNLLRKPERSLMSAFAVLLAVAAFISLLSVSDGVQVRAARMLENRQVDLYVTHPGATPLPVTGFSQTPSVPESLALDLGNDPNVVSAAPVVRFLALGPWRSVVLVGFDSEKFGLFFPPPFRIRRGSMYVPAEKTVVLGGRLAEALGIEPGGLLSAAGQEVRVEGVLYGTGGFEDYFGFLSLTQARSFSGGEGYTEIWLQLKDRSRISEVKEILERKFPSARFMTPGEYAAPLFQLARMLRWVEWGLAGAGIFLALLVLSNVLLLAAGERVREYAALRFLGASATFVFFVVLTESLFLSLAGGAAGVMFGLVGSRALGEALVELFGLPFPVASVSAWLVFKALSLSGMIGVLGGTLSAWGAANSNPMTFLRAA